MGLLFKLSCLLALFVCLVNAEDGNSQLSLPADASKVQSFVSDFGHPKKMSSSEIQLASSRSYIPEKKGPGYAVPAYYTEKIDYVPWREDMYCKDPGCFNPAPNPEPYFPTIYDWTSAQPDLTIAKQAMDIIGPQVFSGPFTGTLFIPTDEAFGTYLALLRVPLDALTSGAFKDFAQNFFIKLLQYHTLIIRVWGAQFTYGATYSTAYSNLNGSPHKITYNGGCGGGCGSGGCGSGGCGSGGCGSGGCGSGGCGSGGCGSGGCGSGGCGSGGCGSGGCGGSSGGCTGCTGCNTGGSGYWKGSYRGYRSRTASIASAAVSAETAAVEATTVETAAAPAGEVTVAGHRKYGKHDKNPTPCSGSGCGTGCGSGGCSGCFGGCSGCGSGGCTGCSGGCTGCTRTAQTAAIASAAASSETAIVETAAAPTGDITAAGHRKHGKYHTNPPPCSGSGCGTGCGSGGGCSSGGCSGGCNGGCSGGCGGLLDEQGIVVKLDQVDKFVYGGGVVHTVNGVLQPNDIFPSLEVALSGDQFSILREVLAKIESQGNFSMLAQLETIPGTIAAPNNDAFAGIDLNTLDAQTLSLVVAYHFCSFTRAYRLLYTPFHGKPGKNPCLTILNRAYNLEYGLLWNFTSNGLDAPPTMWISYAGGTYPNDLQLKTVSIVMADITLPIQSAAVISGVITPPSGLPVDGSSGLKLVTSVARTVSGLTADNTAPDQKKQKQESNKKGRVGLNALSPATLKNKGNKHKKFLRFL